MSTSLIEIIRKRFLDTIRSVNPPDKWKVLVVDEHSQKLLGAVLKTYDVLEENVTLIEAINTRRSPQPTTEAMYLLMPTSANVDRVIADFTGLAEDQFTRLATSPAEPYLRQLVELYLNINAFESRVFQTNAPELFFSFLSPPRDPARVNARLRRLEDDLRYTSKILLNLCITLNENPLIRFYQAPNHGPLGPLAPLSSTSLLPAAAAAPPDTGNSLRWARAAALRATEVTGSSTTVSNIPQGEQLPQKLAFLLQAELDEFRKGNPDFPKPESPQRPRGTLIITDRTMDAVAPLLHEFTYQAMANDLLRVENGRSYKYKFQNAAGGGTEDRTAILSDADVLWTQIRHMHMREAIDKLMADFNAFLEENVGYRAGEGAASLNDMKDMLAGLPQYQEMREKFSLHLTMAQECMDLFEQKKMTATANVEQNCATGVTAAGKTPKTLVEEMVPLLDDRNVSSRDKVRIIALYIMFREGVPEEDQRRLFQHARLSLAEQDAVRALGRLGVRLNRVAGDKDAKKLKFKLPKSEEEEYELSRYKPVLQHVITEHVAGRLDVTAFPYTRDAPTAFGQAANSSLGSGPVASIVSSTARGQKTFGSARTAASSNAAPPSLRSTKSSFARPARGGAVGAAVGSSRNGAVVEREPIRQRVICFVVGGMTYSEIRTAYQTGASLGKDVYIGSTHVLTPERFVDDLKALDMEGIGSAVLPNGLPTSAPAAYQDYYDKRFFTPDAPPPTATAPSNNRGTSKNGGVAPSLRPSIGSPTPSSNSAISTNTLSAKDKKKKGLFHF